MFHVIDDNKDLCDLTVMILESVGYQARCYTDPSEYVDYVNCDDFEPPIAIFTDIRMPEMSGLELINQVHEVFPNQKIVILSGYGSEYEKTKNSVCHFLSKPCSPDELIAIAKSLEICEKYGPMVANPVCKSLLKEDILSDFSCPLDCIECDTKQ